MAEPSSSQINLAFLAAAEFESLGVSGGALVVNGVGRPLEFHCTSPVSVNRTQEILFGQSLSDYVYCEQVAQSLLSEIKSTIDFVLIRQIELLKVAEYSKWPVFFLQVGGEFPQEIMHKSHHTFEFEGIAFASLNHSDKAEQMKQIANKFHAQIPIDEPFERITQALDEAHAIAR